MVLAGGLSPERNVSLSSGAMVSEALREQGHQVALVDLFFGTEGVEGPAEALYDAPVPQAFKRIGRQAPDLAQVRAAAGTGVPRPSAPGAGAVRRRGRGLSGPSRAPAARTAASRRPWICWECPTPGSGCLASSHRHG